MAHENTQNLDAEINQQALDYHRYPTPGKLATEVIKSAKTQQDLSLAYTPGVAEPVRKIHENPEAAYDYTNKGNLVAVISEGSAVLGLGNVGGLAGKPVMEGKGLLFKRFADINCYDIEVSTQDPKAFIETVANIAPTFGGINLEDIAAPNCFEIEEELVKRLDIPVFHDDQHGTAIIICAGLLNSLQLQGKEISKVTIVVLGAGAAGIASVNLLVKLGADPAKILCVDRKGVIHDGRQDLNPYKQRVAVKTDKRTLADAMQGADVFIGVSGPDLLDAEMLVSMAPRPIVFALSNPVPEIRPNVAQAARDDLIMATGRSDYPNQINNVLGFPFIFRGALDVRASTINDEMQKAAVYALRDLAHKVVPETVLKAYDLKELAFGPDYIIPKPFDPRLREWVAGAVARAAVESGVARKS